MSTHDELQMMGGGEESENNDQLAPQSGTIVALYWSSSVSSSVSTSGQVLGVAAFNETESSLLCGSVSFSIIQEHLSENWTIDAIKRTLAPSLYILHPKILSHPTLLEIIVGDEQSDDRVPYQSMKSSMWNASAGISALSTYVSLRSQPNTKLGHQNGYQRFSSLINLEDKMVMSALSALLLHLQSTIFLLDEGRILLSSIKPLQLENSLRIDATTIGALQIFQEERHPNVIRGIGKPKEGYSIFNLLDRTYSPVGRAKLREWMRSPFYDVSRITARQNGVEMVMRPENVDFIASTVKQIKKTADVTNCILRIKKVTSTHVQWTQLYQSIHAGIKIAQLVLMFLNDPDKSEVDKKYLSELFSGLPIKEIEQVFKRLDDTVDIEATLQGFKDIQEAGSNIVYISDGFDEKLDNFRNIYSHLEDILRNAAKQTLMAVPILDAVSVQYVPQVGYLVIIATTDMHLLSPYPDFSFAYSLDEFSYFKSSITAELDERIGDIKADISDRQKVLLLQLENEILNCEEGLHMLNYVIGCLDAIISLGTVAKDLGFIRPAISEDNVVIIKRGRHILQEMSVDSFVPNDTFISTEKNIAMITGPNGSGKSVYIKQVGILVFLAHIGSFLPCEKAIIGLTDSIYARISTVETVSSPESAFACDLTQISRMLQSHTSRSLCLIDEFGKGTSPIDGIALLAATIKHFMRKKAKVFCVLHFTEVFAENILNMNSPESACITAFMMKTYDPKDDGGNGHEDEKGGATDVYAASLPLYTLDIGISPSSEGIPCAMTAGVPYHVLTRAQEIKRSIVSKKGIRPIQMQRQQNSSSSSSSSSKTSTELSGEISHSVKAGIRMLFSTSSWNDAKEEQVNELRKYFL